MKYEVRVTVVEVDDAGSTNHEILSKEIITFDTLGNAISFAQKVWRKFAQR